MWKWKPNKLNVMKDNKKDPENLYSTWTSTKATICFLILISFTYISYSLKYIHPYLCTHQSQTQHFQSQLSLPQSDSIPPTQQPQEPKTNILHIVFGIAASADLWPHRKNYIKLWWRPDQMRGHIWLDQPVVTPDPESSSDDDTLLPPLKISGDTSRFKYANRKGHRSAIRISRIVSESLRLGLENVRWFVLGDDDTVFVTENLVRVLQKYDHNEFYYIGGSSESHLQNIHFSYNMAYGGGGIAISYPLAKALEKMQDRCLRRYPGLYGSDDRLQACMAEIGVPLTREKGFHQFDVYGSVFGLLAAHPVAPLVSLHHLDVVEPIFPNMSRIHALKHLEVPLKIDSAGFAQQSICYDIEQSWTVTISWGYAVQIYRGISSARELELPATTFLNWYKKVDHAAYTFNTRPANRHPCQIPFVYFFSNAIYDTSINQTATEYVLHQESTPECNWKMASPSEIHRIHVHKTPDPHLWDKSPRRSCCRALGPDNDKRGIMIIEVGECHEDEVVEVK